MAGPLASRASRPPTYSGTPALILRRPLRREAAPPLQRLAVLTILMALGASTGGCAVSGMFGIGKEQANALARAETTGSIPSPSKLSTGLPPEADMVYTRTAITEVLTRGRKDASTAWENPATGARGTVTPISVPYSRDGATCHDFLASYLRSGSETWIQGEACRQAEGRWEVKSLRPWKRS